MPPPMTDLLPDWTSRPMRRLAESKSPVVARVLSDDWTNRPIWRRVPEMPLPPLRLLSPRLRCLQGSTSLFTLATLVVASMLRQAQRTKPYKA